jgi:hypothetical protein
MEIEQEQSNICVLIENRRVPFVIRNPLFEAISVHGPMGPLSYQFFYRFYIVKSDNLSLIFSR